jgi:hypothetical protein
MGAVSKYAPDGYYILKIGERVDSDGNSISTGNTNMPLLTTRIEPLYQYFESVDAARRAARQRNKKKRNKKKKGGKPQLPIVIQLPSGPNMY